ncbi:AAA family ATPase [Sagittula sp. NFXS13]|uniref:AAA family ATPase n=1 Tax=Sagittula sp. NFXS13 TaxID=2819095 RepID=UPI0032E03C5B
MTRSVIIVNGVPASGKSTVSRYIVSGLLARDLGAVPLGLDTIKEALYPELGIGDREHNRMLGRASYAAIFNTIAEFPDELVPVVDAWHGFQPRSVLEAHLTAARVSKVIEVWCSVSPEVARRRYLQRDRHPGHPPASYADELKDLASKARAFGDLGPVIQVDTETPPDATIVERISAELRSSAARAT